MKKKDYLQKMERGALIGTSFLLLNGVVGCSLDPMDTPPTETTMTKNHIGPPGATDIIYYSSSQTPVLQVENKKSGFLMDSGYLKFSTTIPQGDNAIIIKMNEDIYGYAKKVTNVEIYGRGVTWFTRANDLMIINIKDSEGSHNTYPAETIFITVHVEERDPIVLSFQYSR